MPTHPLRIAIAVAFSIAFPATSAAAPSEDEAAIVVTATRQAQRINELLADVSVIERETLERLGSGTVAELLARQPGVQVNRLGGPGTQTEVVLRGARSEQTKVLIDGVSVNSMDLRGSPLRYLALDDVERIEILRGPAGAVHGSDAIGGVIQIITRRPAQGVSGEAFAGTGSYGTDKFSGAAAFADERWSIRVSAADHRSDGFSTVRNATNRDADADGLHNRSTGLNLGFRPAPDHEFLISGQTNRGQSQSDGTTGAGTFDNRIVFRNEVWSLTARNTLTENWKSTFRWAHVVDEQNSYTSAAATGFSPLRSTNRSLSWQSDLRLPLGQGLLVAETQEQHAAPVSRFPTQNFARLSALQLGWSAAHSGHRWQLGARRDQHSQFGGAGTGTASYGYQINKVWRAHIAAATAFRAPTLYQLYANIAGSLVANPALQPETARNLEIGVAREVGLHTLSWVAYNNRVRDMIDYDAGTTSYRNISRARLRGWTLSAQGSSGAWSYSASLDYLNAVDEASGLRLGRRAKQAANATLDWQNGPWTLGGEVQLVGRRFNRDNETQPMGGYGLLNLSGKWAMNRQTRIEFRVDNLFDRDYVNTMTSNGRFIYAVPGTSFSLGMRHNF
ncbi:MAG: TonB-dependent receptor [Rhodocyclaceae bacterium]|nr:TonB-dependent receptor [Rhodocyclaceae bacterium]MDZ4214396.1 TonB-dependent receptor [Rhodocyclaceae bacterium]